MKLPARLFLTKVLVILSIIGSMLSLYTSSKGWGEVYPFFTWKLYSQPLGTQKTYSEYRIYSKKNGDSEFHRNMIHATPTFSTDEYVYTMNYLVNRTLEDSLNERGEKKRLLLFVKHMVPDEKEYKIVSESYQVSEIIKDKEKYDTTTVVTF